MRLHKAADEIMCLHPEIEPEFHVNMLRHAARQKEGFVSSSAESLCVVRQRFHQSSAGVTFNAAKQVQSSSHDCVSHFELAIVVCSGCALTDGLCPVCGTDRSHVSQDNGGEACFRVLKPRNMLAC